jgi:hexosaminidase
VYKYHLTLFLPFSSWAAEPPSGHLDIRKPAATQFAKDLIGEISTYLPGAYFSTGNDEVEATCYGLTKGDNAGIDKILKPFIDSVHSHMVDKLSKTPVVWEEAALNFPETAKVLKPGTIVEAWTSSANVEKLLQIRKDIKLIHAPSDFFYRECESMLLDCNASLTRDYWSISRLRTRRLVEQ